MQLSGHLVLRKITISIMDVSIYLVCMFRTDQAASTLTKLMKEPASKCQSLDLN